MDLPSSTPGCLAGIRQIELLWIGGRRKAATCPKIESILSTFPFTDIPALLSCLIASFQWSCPLELVPKGPTP